MPLSVNLITLHLGMNLSVHKRGINNSWNADLDGH